MEDIALQTAAAPTTWHLTAEMARDCLAPPYCLDHVTVASPSYTKFYFPGWLVGGVNRALGVTGGRVVGEVVVGVWV